MEHVRETLRRLRPNPAISRGYLRGYKDGLKYALALTQPREPFEDRETGVQEIRRQLEARQREMEGR